MSSGGWLSTKKRGRDDDEIKRAREVAAVRRKSKNAANKPKKKPKKKTPAYESDSCDSFIVDEEEYVSEPEESEEEEDLVLDDESSGDDLDTFLRVQNKKRVLSRPPPVAKRNTKKSAQLKKKLKSPIVLELSSDSENDDTTFAARPKKPTKAARKPTVARQKSSAVADDSDDDDDDSLLNEPTFGKKQQEKPSQSRFFQKKKASKVAPTKKRLAILDDDDDVFGGDCLIDSPTPQKKSKATSKVFHKKAARKKTSRKHPAFADDGSDEDEDMAVALALSKSLEEARKTSKTPSTAPESNDEEEEDVIDLLKESSDEEMGDEEDEYADPAAKEASSVLDKANALSAYILKALSKWSDSVDSAAAAEKGMISNGAVALSTMSEQYTANDHTWISKNLMAKICPTVTLADYQLIGVNWIALLHGMKCDVDGSKSGHTNVNGILADEMGLGKTVQSIAFLSWLNHSQSLENKASAKHLPHIVIAPASVLSNWEREFEKFAPHLNVVRYHGSMAERQELQQELRIHLPEGKFKRKASGIKPLDVILAPITYFQKEKSDDRSFLRKFRYGYLVVDEAHVLKNPKGTRYKTLDRLNTEHRLLLTGTPVQNSPQELLSLLCFLMPLFSKRNSSDNYDDEKTNDGGENMLRHFVSLERGATSTDEAAYLKLKQLFAPFVLRRRKVDVLSQVMPPKTHKVEIVELDSEARSLYDSILSNHIQAKKLGHDTAKEHLFTNLRKASHHPLLLRSRYQSPAEKKHLTHHFYKYGAFQGEGCTQAKVGEALESYNDFQIHLTALELIEANHHRRSDLERYVLREDDLFASSKFVRLRKLLPEMIGDGHRILIFSVWTSCLDLLSCLLESMGLDCLRMEGSTPVSERQSLIDKFNNDTSIPVFLLSTKACGLGINLTSADTCIFHDLDFNPMNDIQAEDRCHRIGQKKPVTVIRMVAKDTVDYDIHLLQQRKVKMTELIMATKGSEVKTPSTDSAKEKNQLLESAMNRFLKSPTLKNEKENRTNVERDDV